MSGYQWVEQAKSKLEKVDLPFSTISLLVDKCFDLKLNEFLLLDEVDCDELDRLLSEVLKKEIPIAQLVGYEIFYGYKIKVNKNVLIPRVETEELVNLVINDIRKKYPVGSILNIADVCTGSGVIGLVIHQELKSEYQINLTVSDISSSAIEVARINFKNHGIDPIILEGDLLTPFLECDTSYDIVVSNPPYIPNGDVLEAIVIKNEPSLALFGGVEGYEPYLKIIDQVQHILKPISQVYFEIGDGQGEFLKDYIDNKLICNVFLLNDLFDRERMIKIEIGE